MATRRCGASERPAGWASRLFFTATELEQPIWRIGRHTHQYPIEKRLAAEIPLARQDFLDMASSTSPGAPCWSVRT